MLRTYEEWRELFAAGELDSWNVADILDDWAEERGSTPGQPGAKSSNAIMIIRPYKPSRHAGTWVFDDPATGLLQEPFVAGVPQMIDSLVADIPDAASGFVLLFSASPFPGWQRKITWLRSEEGGNWYKADNPPIEGWLCPALFRYFEGAPMEIYVRADKEVRS